MWGEMQAVIMMIAEGTWVLFVFVLLIHLFSANKDRSDTIALTVWCLADFVSTAFSPSLYKYVADGSLDYATWYLAFVVLNCTAVVVIKIAHEKHRLYMTKFCVSIIGLLLLMSFLHTLRMLDWLHVTMLPKSEMDEALKDYTSSTLASIYRYGLMTTKIFAVYLIASQVWITQRSNV